MQNLKYKTEKHLKARLAEMASINRKLLDVISFTAEDICKGTEAGLDADECKEILARLMGVVKNDATS